MTPAATDPGLLIDAAKWVLLHAAHGTSLPLSTRLAVGAVAGLAATLVTTLAMWQQSHGYVPAYVAAGVLMGEQPRDVPRSAAHATHLAVGTVLGALYETGTVGVQRVRDALIAGPEFSVLGLVSAAEIGVAVLLVAALYLGFARLVFPRAGGNAYETRPGTVRRQWAVSATVYGLSLLVAAGTLYEVLPL